MTDDLAALAGRAPRCRRPVATAGGPRPCWRADRHGGRCLTLAARRAGLTVIELPGRGKARPGREIPDVLAGRVIGA